MIVARHDGFPAKRLTACSTRGSSVATQTSATPATVTHARKHAGSSVYQQYRAVLTRQARGAVAGRNDNNCFAHSIPYKDRITFAPTAS